MRVYKCGASEASEISEKALKAPGIAFPDAYESCEGMALLAQSVKKAGDSSVCILPFCRTLEAEALGGNIKPGTDKACPRAGDPAYDSLEEIAKRACDIDFGQGRIKETLDAVRLLKKEGETVALELTGPVTVLSSLTDARKVFKALRRERETAAGLMRHLSSQTLRFIEEGKDAGVDIFIFSDSAGAPEIVGPKLTEQLADDYLCDFLKAASGLMDDSCVMLLCSKYYHALTSLGKADERKHAIECGIRFSDALLSLRGQIGIAGQLCVKHKDAQIVNGIIRELVL